MTKEIQHNKQQTLKRVSKVISYGYIGGDDEELGGYCEPLVVQLENRSEEYLLHRMGQHIEGLNGPESEREVVNDHQRLVVPSKLELMEKWKFIRDHLRVGFDWVWENTDSTCGYDLTPEEFCKTKRKNKNVE